eukprot:COSAG04_NODE_2042_length_4939_cov_10.170868_4_plen_69_part_00
MRRRAVLPTRAAPLLFALLLGALSDVGSAARKAKAKKAKRRSSSRLSGAAAERRIDEITAGPIESGEK